MLELIKALTLSSRRSGTGGIRHRPAYSQAADRRNYREELIWRKHDGCAALTKVWVQILVSGLWRARPGRSRGLVATIVADDYAMQKCQQTSTYSTCRSILR